MTLAVAGWVCSVLGLFCVAVAIADFPNAPKCWTATFVLSVLLLCVGFYLGAW